MKKKKKTLEQRVVELETEVMLLKAQRIQIIPYYPPPVYPQNPYPGTTPNPITNPPYWVTIN